MEKAIYLYNKEGSTTTQLNSNQIIRHVNKFLPPQPSRILEIGCGNGWFTSMLAEMGHQVMGIDTSESGIKIASISYPSIHFEVASAYHDLRQWLHPVDVIISLEVIEHLFSPLDFLANVYQTLRPGGSLILSTPYHGYLKNLAISLLNRWDQHFGVDWEGGHIKFFSQKTLSRMLIRTGFHDITYANAGRVPGLWKSMVCFARK